ncbi:proton-conducting transporter transmembrane domain-containing protein [Wolbachia endosymbiont of Howardula sp.]|uniref:proton-conducting transporter transmembrane domain-containing protein n=1 Tax=Wolbachia endosymbiont of Howardula sp. TaxID=2916816 RepID=UPI00217DC23A|nr:proton-conducting transporter membrane subunit [Wolbachia endosymbiont of Howardula sp.]UWI83251.1 cation:proton antiporter [Wolbachia endosymbiont of Howardula sp.]
MYKFLLLLLLTILITSILILCDYSDTKIIYPHLAIINLDFSIQIILLAFLLGAFLIVLSIINLTLFELISFFAYTISTLCMIASTNMIFIIVFCELMALSAFFIIAYPSNKDNNSAVRYACLHFFSGIILTIGLASHSFTMINIGLLINCACLPFSFWVADAYTAASLHGSAYLAFFTTKASFLVLILHTANTLHMHNEILAFLGIVTAIYGIIFAAIERNIRRLFAYNIVGQIGMLLLTYSLLKDSLYVIPLLIWNIIISMIYQLLLTSVAHSIIAQKKEENLNAISISIISVEGICALIAILTMVGCPGTAGFIIKSYTSEFIPSNTIMLSYLQKCLNLLLYLSVGVKFIYYLFIRNNIFLPLMKIYNKNSIWSTIPMVILSICCIIGGNPYILLYNQSVILDLIYYKNNVLFQLIVILCFTLLFIPMHKLFYPRISIKRDIDWILKSCVLHYLQSFIKRWILRIKAQYTLNMNILIELVIHLHNTIMYRLIEIFGYHSISFVISTSLFLMSILLVLLCFNH